MPLRYVERGEAFGCIVETAEESQRLVVQRLHAERHPVHPCLRQCGIVGCFDRGGIAFQRHFDARRKAPEILRLAQQRSEEHTSELQSLMRISYAVFCLKKQKPINLSYTTLHA